MPIDTRQYDSALEFIKDDAQFSRLVGNLTNSDDKTRIKAYELYEDYYHNRPEHIRVTLRGEDDDSIEIYMPSAKKCVEAVNRFLAIDFDYTFDPESGGDNPELGQPEVSRTNLDAALSKLFQKQEIPTKFNNMKRYMLMKGDALLHIRAIPWEKAGRRIVIDELKPEHYFPIEDLASGAAIGCHIVDVVRNPRNSPKTRQESDEWIVRRQTYRRQMLEDPEGHRIPTGRITSQLAYFKMSKWDDRTADSEVLMIEEIVPEFVLPERIQSLPVYHWRNSPPPNSTFGLSALAGVESLINAMNQAATDEDLTLITQGLGVFWTDASPPVDENGNEVEWEIGPGAVVQVSTGANFGRVTGVSSVAPYHEHIKLLDEHMQQAMAVPDVAIGMVDVQAVESGIALQLKFGPLLAQNKEKEPSIKKVADEFLEDLLDWLAVYEGVESNGVVVTAQFGDPMPKNKSQDLQDILSIWTQANVNGQILPTQWLFDRLNELFGWDLSEIDLDTALEEAKRISEATTPADPFGAAMDGAMGDEEDEDLPFGNNGSGVPFASLGG
ncbi:portal protein [Mycobacterium phage Aikoy]|nr:portal protein [Mycobacterium phage Aikoy]